MAARSLVDISEPLVHINSLDFIQTPSRRPPQAAQRHSSAATPAPANLDTLTRDFGDERRGTRQRYDVQLPPSNPVQREAVEVLTFNNDGVQTANVTGLAPIIHGSQRERELAAIQERRRRLSAVFADGAGATNGGVPASTSSFTIDRTHSAPADLTSLVLRGMHHTGGPGAAVLPSAVSARSSDQSTLPSNTVKRVGSSAEASNPRPRKRLRQTSPSLPQPTDSSVEVRSRFFDRLSLDSDNEAGLMFIRDPAYEPESDPNVAPKACKALSPAQDTALPVNAQRAAGGMASVVSHVVRAAAVQIRRPPAIATSVGKQLVIPAPLAVPPTVRRVPFGKASSGPPRFKATSLQSGSSATR